MGEIITEFEKDLINQISSGISKKDISFFIEGIKNNLISEKVKNIFYNRIQIYPETSINALEEYFFDRRYEPFSEKEKEIIFDLYQNALKPIVENIETIDDIENFMLIRELYIDKKMNFDFLLDTYISEISPCFKESKKKVIETVEENCILTEEEINFIDEFYNAELSAYVLSKKNLNNIKKFYQNLNNNNKEKIKDCKCFGSLVKEILSSPKGLNEERFMFVLELIASKATNDENKKDFFELEKSAKFIFSDESIKEIVADEEKKKIFEQFFKENEKLKEIFKNNVDEILIEFLKDINKDENQLTDEDKRFYEEYLKIYFKESFHKHKYEADGFELFNQIQQTKFLEGEKGIFFKEQYEKYDIWKEFCSEVTKQHKNIGVFRQIQVKFDQLKEADIIFKQANLKYPFMHESQIAYLKSFVMQLKKCNLDEIKQMECMEQFVKKLISHLDNIKNVDSQKLDKTFEIVNDYIKILMKKDKNALIDFDSVSQLNQLLQTDKLPEKYKEQIKLIFENNKENLKFELPNMEMYEEKITNFQDMNLEEFSNLVDDIKKIKVVKGKIPEKYCDYMIAQKLNRNSILNQNLDNFFPIFKRVFEDKTLYELEKNKTKNYIIKFQGKGQFDGKSTLGNLNQDKKTITYNKEQLYKLDEKNASMLRTIFHEVHHAYQYKQVQEGTFNKTYYNILKEEIVKNKDEKFYDVNYKFMQIEIDARITASVKQLEYLKKIGLVEKKIANYDIGDINNCLKGLIQLELSRKGRVKNKKYNGKDENVDIVFQNIIKKNPKLIEENPILGIEFDLKGNRKGNIEILKEYEKALNIKKESLNFELVNDFEQFDQYERFLKYKNQKDRGYLGIYTEVLRNESKMSAYKILEDISQINRYKPEHPAVRFYLDFIISQKILPEFKKWKKYKKIDLSDEENLKNVKPNGVEALEKRCYEKSVEYLYRYAKENPKNFSSKLILENLDGELINEGKEYNFD